MITIGVFYALMFAVGIYASRRRLNESTESMLVAGRGMPLLLGAFTMTATWVGGGYINGTAEQVYSSGLIWTQPPWGYALSLVVGGLFFAGIMRRAGYTTLLDPFEHRYGKSTAAVLFLPALVGEVFWSAAILTALGSTFGTILELDFTTSILISAAVAVGYTLLGGLWAVAYTDVVQLVCILLGLSVALPFALEYVGGISTLWPAYQDRFGAAASLVPPIESFWGQGPMADSIWTWVDFALMLILGGIPWQVYFQRVLACRDEKTAVRLSLLAAVGCLIMAVPAVMLGAIGATVDWQSAGATPPEDAVLVLPHVLRYLTPPIVGLIGLGAVSAAVMSSVDSSILSASSMFAWNVYRPLLRPEAGQRELRRSVRASVLVVGTLATVLALRVKSVYGLWFLCADFVYVILFPQLVTALYFKRSTRIGAIAGMVVGLFFRLAGGVPELGIPPLISKLVGESVFSELFQYKTLSMLASLATIFAVSWLTPGGQKAGNHPVGAALS